MAERYTRLFTAKSDLYVSGSPVILSAGALLKDNQTGKVLAQLKIKNIGQKRIKAAKVHIDVFDTVGRPLGDAADFEYLDLKVVRDEEFGQKTLIPLPNTSTRAFSVTVTEVAFADNSVWKNDSEYKESLPKPMNLAKRLSDPELVKQYGLRYGQTRTWPEKVSDLWYCACGAVNHENEKKCHRCNSGVDSLLACDLEELKAERDQRLAEEKAAKEAKEAAERAAKEAVIKKTKKILSIGLPIAAVCIAAFFLISKVIIPNNQYKAAEALLEAGQYEEAIAAFEMMGGYKDSDARIKEVKAMSLIDAGDYENAYALLEEIGNNDAITASKYDRAVALIDAGDYENAYALLKEIGNDDAITASKYDRAVALIDAGDYENAYALLEEIGNKDAIAASKHDRAVALIDSGDYEAAYALMEEIGNKDAIAASKYDRAVALLDAGDYENAYALLEEIGNNDAIAESRYNRAIALIDSEDYEAALALLDGLNYKDSASKMESIKAQYYSPLFTNAQVGSYVSFGAYEQDNNTSNGKEPIEWLVLEKEDDRLLVISKYALDCQQYNTKYTIVTWESCSLRKWLNDTFLNAAFSADEQTRIPTVTVSADKNPIYSTSPGSSTQDQVFLLSIPEVNKYFNSDKARKCAPTAYAIAQGVSTLDRRSGDNKDTCLWWLRSPGSGSPLAAGVHIGGSVNTSGERVSLRAAVRPALWINLGS